METYEASRIEDNDALIASRGDQEDVKCVNYYPGMLAETEDELNAASDKVFEEAFFCGC